MKFEIYAFWLDWVQEKVTELNKRADKIGTTPIEISVIEEFQVKRKGQTYTKLLIEVTGESPAYEGWMLIGVIDHDVATVLNAVPGYEIPVKYRNASEYGCDHCHRKIRRVKTYIIQHEGGEIKRVGSTCLRDFLGHMTVKQMIAWADYLEDVTEICESGGEFEGGGQRVNLVDMRRFLAVAVLQIKRHGWVSKTRAAEEFISSTLDDIWGWFDNARKGKRPEAPTKEMYEKADAILDWATSLEGDLNDYLWNLHVIATAAKENYGQFRVRHSGYVASMPVAYDNEMERARKRSEITSVHVGEIKKRSRFELKLIRERVHDGGRFISWIYAFEDKDGNQFTWFSSQDKDLEEGMIYSGKATVKDHSEFRGVPQTIITRFSISESGENWS